MKPVIIIRTGRAPDAIRARFGDFPQWFRVGACLDRSHTQAIDVEHGEALPPPQDIAGAIITGSGAMVTDGATWSERTAGWIRAAMDIELPLFGVCFGHQLMAHALGGRVDYLPGGREMGTQSIETLPAASNDPLAGALPSAFRAHTTHEQSVLEPPRGAIVLARSARDPNQLLRYGPHAVSSQFHPEFSADIMRAYVRRRRAVMRSEGSDPDRIYHDVAATPIARRLLRQFATHRGLATPAHRRA